MLMKVMNTDDTCTCISLLQQTNLARGHIVSIPNPTNRGCTRRLRVQLKMSNNYSIFKRKIQIAFKEQQQQCLKTTQCTAIHRAVVKPVLIVR